MQAASALVQDAVFNVLPAPIFHLSIHLTYLFILNVNSWITFRMSNGVVWAIVAAVRALAKRNSFR